MAFTTLQPALRHLLVLYERYARRLDLSALRGFDLACFCKETEPCHADILLRLANP